MLALPLHLTMTINTTLAKLLAQYHHKYDVRIKLNTRSFICNESSVLELLILDSMVVSDGQVKCQCPAPNLL